jgi:hypothetical protein
MRVAPRVRAFVHELACWFGTAEHPGEKRRQCDASYFLRHVLYTYGY